MLEVAKYSAKAYFYPRPLRRGRRVASISGALADQFLSTPSSQRATRDQALPWLRLAHFYPRPLRRGRHGLAATQRELQHISIHALFAEGDFVDPAAAD